MEFFYYLKIWCENVSKPILDTPYLLGNFFYEPECKKPIFIIFTPILWKSCKFHNAFCKFFNKNQQKEMLFIIPDVKIFTPVIKISLGTCLKVSSLLPQKITIKQLFLKNSAVKCTNLGVVTKKSGSIGEIYLHQNCTLVWRHCLFCLKKITT